MKGNYHANTDGSIEIDGSYKVLSPKEAINIVNEAFEINSHVVKYEEFEKNINLFTVGIGDEETKYYVHIRSVCKGGRDRLEEHRIQPTGALCNRLVELENEGKNVLMLGVYKRNDIPIIVAWKPEVSSSDGSISKFININNIAEAIRKGFSQYLYNPDNFACAFRKEFIHYYIYNRNNLHRSKDDHTNYKDLNITQSKITIDRPYNRIIFGAPGTGKSHILNQESIDFKDENFERVTFHPSYSYSQFVGTYKPKPLKVGGTDITYEYVPGPFLRLWQKAYKSQRDNETPENYLIIIEEINRANVASVFGDIFQLLDRKNGESEYMIATSEDMREYLAREEGENIEEYYKIKLPNNFYIWATMNSADQGVFPMDTAFKRRWSFEYIDIDAGEEKIENITVKLGLNEEEIKWNKLRKKINEKLISLNIKEDKLIGPFFLGIEELKSEENFDKAFKSKLLMYLYEDVLRHKNSEFFKEDLNTYSKLIKSYDEKGGYIFNFNLEYEIIKDESQIESEEQSSEDYEKV